MAEIDNFRVVPGMTRTSTIDGKRVRKLAFIHKVTGELHFFSKKEIEELQTTDRKKGQNTNDIDN